MPKKLMREVIKPEAAKTARRRRVRAVFTVGHSTRSEKDFIALLQAHRVKLLADVRSIPRSRHNPQFNRERLAAALKRAGIRYVHLKELGGLRRARCDSLNTAWRNASFRGFADYMQTREFAEGLGQLMKMAKTRPTAIMCAEVVPWRCHRSLIGDALLAQGYRVEELASLKRTRAQVMTPWARVRGTQVTYPAAKVATEPRRKRQKIEK